MQKKILDVLNVSTNPGRIVWCIHHLREDGTEFNYAFPAEALQNLSAEYGINPLDVDTLLETYLYQFHMDSADLHQMHPHFVWNTTEDNARVHHLARVEKLKKEIEFVDPYGKLDIIKQHHLKNFDTVKHQEYRELCHSLRRKRVEELSGKKIS